MPTFGMVPQRFGHWTSDTACSQVMCGQCAIDGPRRIPDPARQSCAVFWACCLALGTRRSGVVVLFDPAKQIKPAALYCPDNIDKIATSETLQQRSAIDPNAHCQGRRATVVVRWTEGQTVVTVPMSAQGASEVVRLARGLDQPSIGHGY